MEKDIEIFFDNIIGSAQPIADELDTFGILSFEYSRHIEEKKSFPLDRSKPVAAVCWSLSKNRNFSGTILPLAVPYSIQKRYPAEAKTQLHTHDYLELGYVISGSFRQSIMGKDVTFSEGELCLIDKNCLHQDYLDESDTRVLFLGISKEAFEEIMSRKYADDRIISFLQSALLQQKNLLQYLHFKPYESSNEKMRECMLLLLKELADYDVASDLICRGLLVRIFRLLGTGYEFSLSRELKKEKNWLFYEEITEYIKYNYQDISLEELCEKFHFQQDYFARMLKKQTGLTFIGYVQEIRLNEARRLLLETDVPIEEIAEAVGYQNKGYFYRIFTKRFDETPAKMRKNR
ncbi:MAG: AraC family transcriptional regulator [Lachnospiraceae bacterium]|nr:AraC family transcriptional regulator [Lachnospiraceae bacterium]